MLVQIRRIALISIVFILTCSHVLAQQPEAQFFSSAQDIPVMPSLYEISEAAFAFDKPEGRIVSVQAESAGVSEGEVIDFYKTVLVEFGWVQQNSHSYIRGNEVLDVDTYDIQDGAGVQITIRPKS